MRGWKDSGVEKKIKEQQVDSTGARKNVSKINTTFKKERNLFYMINQKK